MATRAGFTYREAEELRLAVGEAAALLAPDPDGDGTLVIAYDVEDVTLGFAAHSDQERILERELTRFMRFYWDAAMGIAGTR